MSITTIGWGGLLNPGSTSILSDCLEILNPKHFDSAPRLSPQTLNPETLKTPSSKPQTLQAQARIPNSCIQSTCTPLLDNSKSRKKI